MRVTIACPQFLIADANQLARCLGYSEADGETFGESLFQDQLGNYYAVASGIMKDGFLADAMALLQEPEWGADMDAAARAQALILVGNDDTPLQAVPENIVAFVGTTKAAMEALGVFPASDVL